MTKKILSLLLAFVMTLTMFAGFTVASNADEAYQLASGALSAGDEVIIALKDGDDYYAFPNANSSGVSSKAGIKFTVTAGVATAASTYTFVVYENGGHVGLKSTEGNNYIGLNSGKLACNGWGDTKYLVITEQGNGLYTITSETASGRGLTTSGTNFTCSNDSSTPVYIFKLSEVSGGGGHTHSYSWNGVKGSEGNHTLVCANTDGKCTELTKTESCTYTEDVPTPATCVETGVKTYTCSVCGYSYDETIPATGIHTDADKDGVCDDCGNDMPAVPTKASSINVGDVIVFVCESSGKELTGFSETSTVFGIGSEYTGAPSGAFAFTVESGAESGTFAFINGDDYLSWSSGNSLSTSATLNENSSWTVSFDDDGNAFVANAADETRKIRWNSSSPRFACYTSTQTDIQIYTVAGSAHVHDWSAWTSNNDGTHTRTCSAANCPSSTETKDCSYTDAISTPATCVAAGVKTYTCSVCGYSYEEPIPATGIHTDADKDGACDDCGTDMPAAEAPEGLEFGKAYILVYVGEEKSYELTGVNNNIGTAAEYITTPGGNYPLELVDAGNGLCAFKDSDGKYIAYTKSEGTTKNNNLFLVETIDTDGAKWNVTANANGTYTIVNVYNTERTLRFNTTSTQERFCCYTGSTGSAELTLIEVTCVHNWGDGVVTTAATCTTDGLKTYTCSLCGETKTEIIPAAGHTDADEDGVCETCGYKFPRLKLTTSLKDGDKVVIVFTKDGLAMTTTASGAKLAGAEVTPASGVLALKNESVAVLTVEYDDDTNFYLKSADGKYLTSDENGNGVSFTDDADDCSLWYLTDVDPDAGTVGIMNVGANYNGNHNQALEYYSGFTTYGWKDNNDAYKFSLYALEATVSVHSEAVVKPHPDTGKKSVSIIGGVSGITEANVEDYGCIRMSVVFKKGGVEVNSREVTFTEVYSTVRGVASTDEGTAASHGAYVTGADYIYALRLSGDIPEGDYTVEVAVQLLATDGVTVIDSAAANVAFHMPESF